MLEICEMEIRQHKQLAMGKDVDVGGDCASPFNGQSLHGGAEVSKKKHLSDNRRSQKPLSRTTDHGDHGLNTPRDGYSD